MDWAPIIIAALASGFFVKVLEHIRTRPKDDRQNLRGDIEHLRGEIKNLRTRVAGLEHSLMDREQQIMRWQRVYWRMRTKVMLLVDHLRVTADTRPIDDRLDALLSEIERDEFEPVLDSAGLPDHEESE